MSAFRPVTHAEIGRVYRQKLGGNPFGIQPDIPPKPLVLCHLGTCDYTWNPNDGTSTGTCKGYCSGC